MSPLVSPSLWDDEPIVDRVASMVLDDTLVQDEVSVLNILATIQDDESLSSISLEISSTTAFTGSLFAELIKKASGAIAR